MTDETAPGTAASELFADRPTPTEAPAGFFNPGAGVYTDQLGNLRYHRSNEQLAEDRKAWIDGFDQAARRNKFDKSEPPERYSAEARQARIEAFDRGARADGYTPVEPPPPEVQRAADLSMTNLAAKPQQYSVDVSTISSPETSAGTASEMTALAAELEFLPGAGNGFLERMVKATGERKAARATPAAWEAFAGNARAVLLQRAGGDEATLNEQISQMRSMLLSVRGAGAGLAKALAENAGSLDKFVFASLLNRAVGRAQFYKSSARH